MWRWSLISVVRVLNQFVGVGKHGKQESGSVQRALAVLKCNDYTIPQPQCFDNAGNRFIVHLLIMTIRPKAICLPSDTSSGGSQFSMLIALSLSIITVGWTGFAKMSKS